MEGWFRFLLHTRPAVMVKLVVGDEGTAELFIRLLSWSQSVLSNISRASES